MVKLESLVHKNYLVAESIATAVRDLRRSTLSFLLALVSGLHLHAQVPQGSAEDQQVRVPNVAGNVANPVPPDIGANGAFCGAGELRCFAGEWSVVNYLEKEFSTRNFVSLRTDFLNDLGGQRTGFPTMYSEHELMWGH